MSNVRPIFVSLFCGAGGFDLGFIQAGFQCIAAYDINPIAVDVHKVNLGSVAEVCDLSLPGFSFSLSSEIDVLIAGPPCQGFSTVGKRDVQDPRNNLLLIAGKIASVIRPRVFVAENVTGVTSGQHKDYWNSLRRNLISVGYSVGDLCCDVSKIGVPQVRKRMVMIANRGRMVPDIGFPSNKGSVLRDALSNIDGASGHDPQALPVASYHALIAAHIKPRQKLCNVRSGERSVHTWDIPEVFGYTTNEERQI